MESGMRNLDDFDIRLSKYEVIFTYTVATAVIVGCYLIKTPPTYFTFFYDGIGRIILYIMHAYIILLMIQKCFFIYRAFSKKPYVEFLDKKIIIRLKKEEIFDLKDYKFISAKREFHRIIISDDNNKPIFMIPAQFLVQKDIDVYINQINRKYRCDN